MTNKEAWDYAIGLLKVDSLEPTEDFKRMIELEKKGEITREDLKKYLDYKYSMFSKLKKAEERASREGWIDAENLEKELEIYDI